MPRFCHIISSWVCNWVKKYCVLDLHIRYSPLLDCTMHVVILVLVILVPHVGHVHFALIRLQRLTKFMFAFAPFSFCR